MRGKQNIEPKRGKMWMYLSLLTIALLIMLMLRTCSETRPLSPVRDRPSKGDTIDVAIDYSPLSLYRYGDTLGGFNYEILGMLRDSFGVAIKLHPVATLSEATEGLDRGLYDVVAADIPLTTDLHDLYAYSEPVFLDKQVLVQPLDSQGQKAITTQLDLAGKHVWVTSKSPVIYRLRNLAAEIGDTIIVEEDATYGPEQLFILTATGEIPLSVVNERTARILQADYPNVDISTRVSFTQFQSWLMRKGDSITVDTINAMLRRIKEWPVYDEILNKY